MLLINWAGRVTCWRLRTVIGWKLIQIYHIWYVDVHFRIWMNKYEDTSHVINNVIAILVIWTWIWLGTCCSSCFSGYAWANWLWRCALFCSILLYIQFGTGPLFLELSTSHFVVVNVRILKDYSFWSFNPLLRIEKQDTLDCLGTNTFKDCNRTYLGTHTHLAI